MKSFLLKLVSGPDNQTPDLARVLFLGTWVLWAVSCVMYLYGAKSIADIASAAYLNLFGVGSALLLSGAGAIWIKKTAEPATATTTTASTTTTTK